MPIPREVIYICKNCGYSETRIVGDVLGVDDLFKICPKCGSKMSVTKSRFSEIYIKCKSLLKGLISKKIIKN